jgi:hypothetical protein
MGSTVEAIGDTMTIKIVSGWDLGLENRRATLKNLDETYPTWLEYNVKGEAHITDEVKRLVVPNRSIELLPGNRYIDLHVRIQRSGDDFPSIDADEERLQAFFDALSFSELGRAFDVMPRLRSAETRITVPLNEDKIREAVEVLENVESLTGEEKDAIERALKWYRESFGARSLFNRYSMLWNCLEIVASRWGTESQTSRRERLEAAKSFLLGKGESLALEDLSRLQNEIVQDSIRARMSRGFERLFGAEASIAIDLCFSRSPAKARLWEIRNDINHGNIVQRDPTHRDIVLAALFDLDKVAWNTASGAMGLGRQIPW